MKWLGEIALCFAATLCGSATVAQDAQRQSERGQRADQDRRDVRSNDQSAAGDQQVKRTADDGQKPKQQAGGQGSGGQRRGGLFRFLDVDRDGILSAKEIDRAAAMLMRLDTNRDGVLDAEELNVRVGGGQGRGNAKGGQRRELRGGIKQRPKSDARRR